MSAEILIIHNDFEGAKARFENANARWKKHWLTTCQTIANNNPHLAERYEFDFDTLTIKVLSITPARTTIRRCGEMAIPMNYLPCCGEDVKGQQTAYLFKFYTSDRTIPIFSKIGTTAKSVNERLRDEIGEYRKKFDIQSVDICKIYDCGEMPAESYESFLRAVLMKKFPNSWHKNDRFFGVDIPTDIFTTLCDTYANM